MGFFKTLFSGKEESEEEKDAKRQENNFDVLKFDGIQALRIGRADYAIACLTHALDIKADAEAQTYLVNAYLRKGDIESAAEELEEMCGLYPNDARYPVTLADLLYQLERYDEMDDICQQAINIDPDLAGPYYHLARKQLTIGDYDHAEENVTLAIEKSETPHDALLLRAEILQKKENYEQALADVEQLIGNDSGDDEVLMQKGMILEAMGNVEEALTLYNNVLEENPFIPEAYAKIAGIQLNDGQLAEAAQTIDDAIEQIGEQESLLRLRSELRRRQGDEQGALTDQNRADELKAEQEQAMGKQVDIEQEMRERYNSVNPFG